MIMVRVADGKKMCVTMARVRVVCDNGVCVWGEHLNRCKTSYRCHLNFSRTVLFSKQGACGHHANACQRNYA